VCVICCIIYRSYLASEIGKEYIEVRIDFFNCSVPTSVYCIDLHALNTLCSNALYVFNDVIKLIISLSFGLALL